MSDNSSESNSEEEAADITEQMEVDNELLSNDDDELNIKQTYDDDIIIVFMDIRSSIQTLKDLLQHENTKNLHNFEVWLQNVQMLHPDEKLVDQCFAGVDLAQVNVEILYDLQRINIVDVVKPPEEVLNENKSYVTSDKFNTDAGTLCDDMNSNDSSIKIDSYNDEASKRSNKNEQECVNWVVDRDFLNEKRKYGIPKDPLKWMNFHISIWLKWAVNQFDLHVEQNDWNFSGKELCELSLEDFQKKVPRDPGNKFWTHLEILRKCNCIAVPGEPNVTLEAVDIRQEHAIYKKAKRMGSESCSPNQHNRSGNKQIKLWQFLLDILTDPKHLNIIRWIDGCDGEFIFADPEGVAKLWGERKNKPAMNYEKLSRALRYYYDGHMLAKCSGKHFVYKFVCDLKTLIDSSAQDTFNRVRRSQGK